jgi:hypothetical protein
MSWFDQLAAAREMIKMDILRILPAADAFLRVTI